MSMILRPVLQQAGSWQVPRIWCRVEEVPDPGCGGGHQVRLLAEGHTAHLDLDIVGGAPLQQPLLRGQLPVATVNMYPCTPVPLYPSTCPACCG